MDIWRARVMLLAVTVLTCGVGVVITGPLWVLLEWANYSHNNPR